jgi:hypothetical protein
MLLNELIKPQITFNKGGGSGGGGSSSKSSAPKSSPRPKARPAPKPKKSGGRNLDADNFAGSDYAPTKNAGTSKAKQVTYTHATDRDDRRQVPVTGATTSFNSRSSVSAKDLADGNVSEYKSKTGQGGIIVSRGTTLDQAPQVDATSGGKTNREVYNDTDVRSTSTTTTTTGTGGGSSSPVTAPKTIDPADGVGGGRDGGKARKSKASKTDEDKIAIKRKSLGISRYQKSNNSLAINKRRA